MGTRLIIALQILVINFKLSLINQNNSYYRHNEAEY